MPASKKKRRTTKGAAKAKVPAVVAPVIREPGEPLANKRHEAFATELAKGTSKAEAYRLTMGGQRTKGKRKTKSLSEDGAKQMGHALLTKTDFGIAARVAEIQAEARSKAVMTLQEIREFYASVVRTPLEAVDKSSRMCKKHVVSPGQYGDTVTIEGYDKIRACVEDSKLAGFLKVDPVEHAKAIQQGQTIDVDVTVNVMTEEKRNRIMEKRREFLLEEAAKAGPN